MRSYDDSDSEDDQISSESEDEIIENMEQVAAEMKNDVEYQPSGAGGTCSLPAMPHRLHK